MDANVCAACQHSPRHADADCIRMGCRCEGWDKRKNRAQKPKDGA